VISRCNRVLATLKGKSGRKRDGKTNKKRLLFFIYYYSRLQSTFSHGHTEATLNNPADSEFIIDDWRVSPQEGLLRRADEVKRLEPKVMAVLVYLAAQAGRVVTREELEREVWRGALIGYDAVTKTVIKLRKALDDDAREPRYIATIPKKGYQLITQVIAAESSGLNEQPGGTKKPPVSDEARPTGAPAGNRTAVKWFAATAGLIILLALWYFSSLQPQTPSVTSAAQTEHPLPAVVVLPFNNLSNDANQDYFSDGITDDIITDLSRVDKLRVIARQSAYHFKNEVIDLSKIARELGVQYIVEGSVQKAGQTIRINVQLTNVAERRQVWAQRYEGALDSIFSIQDKITHQVIEAMSDTLTSNYSRPQTSRSTRNFAAYDTFLQGQQYSKDRTQESYDLTVDAYRKAIQLDPDYARAYGALAVALTQGYRHQWTDLSFEEARERSLQLAKKAVDLNTANPQVYWSVGFVHLFRKEFEAAETAAKRAVTLSPNYADGYGLLAFIANWRGKAIEAEAYIKKAIALNPYHTFDYPWNLGLAYYTQGRYLEAIQALKDALQRNETVVHPRLYLAASYVRLGRMEDAMWEIEQMRILRPDVTISLLTNTMPYESRELMEDFLQDLRKAGLPDS
jgi:adenylate cyclase